MFIFQLMGGLGNQMFQYAAARSLSFRRDIEFKVDFDDPYTYVKRKYSLGIFDVQIEHASKKELFFSKPKRKVLRRLWMALGKEPNCRLFKEKKDFYYDKEFFYCPDGSYVSGFWQSEKYFKPIESIIRSEFKILIKPSSANLEWLEKIKSTNSISIHVRRGDYVHVTKTNAFHGVCNLNYYKEAIRLMESKITDPCFFFFSDDIKWVRENMKPHSTSFYIDVNDELTAYEDLRLMSNCKHAVIANSSFSWWGAWLNSNPHKIIVAPAQWVTNPLINTKDLIPDTWMRL